MSDETTNAPAPAKMPDPQLDAVRASADVVRVQLDVMRAALQAETCQVALALHLVEAAERGIDALMAVIAAQRFNSVLVMNALKSARPARESAGMPETFGSHSTKELDHGNRSDGREQRDDGDASGDALSNVLERI
jgi:hypothetical protein